MVTLHQVKEHARVMHDDDDAELERLIAASEGYLSDIGVDMTQDPLPEAINLAVVMLVVHFFEHPSAMSDARLRTVDIGVDRLIAPHRELCL